ncbi:MAG: class I SAM-dependent methyltransferase [Ramlibacter sp.]
MDDQLQPVAEYYARKLREHGPSARGVDWNGEDSQVLRLKTLLKVFERTGPGSMNDLGCGYGALLPVLDALHPGLSYAGFDLAEEMIEEARRQHAGRPATRFVLGSRPDAVADYTVASGIFNVRLDATDEAWWPVITSTLDAMHETSERGFAFNCLTSYSDREYMRPYLFYADPGRVFDHCKRRYSRQVALLHDYGLYEFTVIVRREGSRP